MSRIWGQRGAIYGGVGLTSFAAVGLSVIVTRMYSAVLGYHFAFFALSLALLGAGFGATLSTLLPRLLEPPRLLARLASTAGLGSATTVVMLIQTLRTKPIENLDRAAFTQLGLLVFASLVPFTLVGLIVTSTLKHARGVAPRLYLADMLGAAAGGLAALIAMKLGAPRAGLVFALTLALAGVVFALGSGDAQGRLLVSDERGGRWAAAAFFLSAVALLTGDYGEQWLTVSTLRYVNLDRATFVEWGDLGLVTVDRPTRGMAWMRVDGSASTSIVDAKTSLPKHPDQMAFQVAKGQGPTLILGAGGGRDVRAALDAKQTEIDAVEINRTIARDVMQDKLREYSGNLYFQPGVNLVVADGRSFVRESTKRWHTIVVSLVDPWSASSVGGLGPSENGLYTVEAIRADLDHLDDGGSLVVNRWDADFPRALALVSAALLDRGATDPGAQLYACSHIRSTSMVVRNAPLSPEDIAALRKICKGGRFVEVFAPDARGTDLLASLTRDPWGTARTVDETDLSPPTDDRPFYFYNVPGRRLRSVLGDKTKLAEEQQGLASLVMVTAATLAFALLFLVAPLFFRRARGARGHRAKTVGFFAASGLGFVLVELALTAILTTFLGHPIYALTTVLAALLATAGLGAYLEQTTSRDAVAGRVRVRAVALVVLLVVLAATLLPATSTLVGLPLGARIALAVAVIAPLGALMGGLAPLGVLAASTRDRDLVSWGWAASSFFGVLGLGLGTLLAMHAGFSYLLFLASVAFFVAAALAPTARRPAPAQT